MNLKMKKGITLIELMIPIAMIVITIVVIIIFKKADSPEVSKDAEKLMSWYEAVVYCHDLDEKGHSDWKLPTITELSVLNKSEGYYWASDKEKIEKKKEDDEDKAWFYDFSAKKREKSLVLTNMHVVCIKNNMQETEPIVVSKEPFDGDTNDLNACKYARKTQADHTWKLYLEKFPNGICAQEAKDALDRIACEKADEDPLAEENQNKEPDKIQVTKIKAWKSYLEKFPDGQCAEEAKQKICDLTRAQNSLQAWKEYLKDFPDGKCAFEAEDEVKHRAAEEEKADEEACKNAENKNSKKIWKQYLEKFPAGKCREKAEKAIRQIEDNERKAREQKAAEPAVKAEQVPVDRPKSNPTPQPKIQQPKPERPKHKPVPRQGPPIWSKELGTNISFRDAEKYCRDLREDDHTDWRLPTIDELRTLVKDRKTASGGECKVSARSGCLSSELKRGCWSFETCAEACENSLDKCSRDNTDGRYSTLGDRVALWSSTSTSDDSGWYWYIDFSNGLLSYGNSNLGSYKFNVRCVRYK